MRKRAGFWIRAAALAVDLAVGGIAALIVSVIVGLAASFIDPRKTAIMRAAAVAFYASLLAYWFFDVLLAKTPAKMVFGLEIANADGSPAGRWRLFWRWSTKTSGLHLIVLLAIIPNAGVQFLEQFISGIVIIGCLAAINDDKRTWHDEWTSTAVFWKARKAATPPALP